jgi:hypothetical protein
METLEQTIDRLELEQLQWAEFIQSEGWKRMAEVLSINISNFNVQVQSPALSLDQLIATNSAAHRLDALKHARSIPALKIQDIQEQLEKVRSEMALDKEPGEHDDFRKNF